MLLPTDKNTKTITDLREKAVELLDQIDEIGPTFIFHHSKPKAVMLSIEEYSNLMEAIEDYQDSLIAKNLEENPEKGGINLVQLAKKYKLPV